LQLADRAVPVTIGERAEARLADDLAAMLGETAAEVLRLHMSVIDREDRLESGTGGWRLAFVADGPARNDAVKEAVLRALRTALDPVNFEILGQLSANTGTPIEELSKKVGLGRLPLAERIGDLVSAGLVSKIPEANQVAGSTLGVAVVDLVERAGKTGGRRLGQDRR
jgi:Winged helix-turn-helix DNA-binding